VLKQNKFNSSDFKPYEIEIKKKWFDSVKLNFAGNVEFVDARADKSKLGFVRMGEGNSFYNFVFPGKSIHYINSKLPDVFKTSGKEQQLLIVVRHFWMCQIITTPISWAEAQGGGKAYISFSYFKADYYLKNGDSVKYAGKLDTIIKMRKWMGKISDDLLKQTLVSALWASNKLITSSALNPNFAPVLLFDSIKNQFNYPIIAVNQSKKGIYRNYQDFLNNNPVEGDFEVKTEKAHTYLLSSTIDSSVTKTAWGYCDGNDIYKQLNESFYKMNRVENTFELAGPRIIRQIHPKEAKFYRLAIDLSMMDFHGGGIMLLMHLTDEKIMRELVPYQLNIKEGTFY
jgi:hypothetical protein